MTQAKQETQTIWLVTGLSGAGMSTALKALEDLGYEAVDNLPLNMVDDLIAQAERPLAIGVDCRTRDFDAQKVLELRARLSAQPDLNLKMMIITCDDYILQQRFNETRRRHPLAIDRPIIDGVSLERERLQPLFADADLVIDTTDHSIHDLRRQMTGHCQIVENYGLLVCVTSFGFSNGVPREADLVFDVRFLANPHYDRELRPLNGRDAPVAKFVMADEAYAGFIQNLENLILPLIPRYQHEGKKYLTIAIGCTGGRHRSVCSAENLYRILDEAGHSVSIHHRDLEKWAVKQALMKQETENKIKEINR